MSLLPFFVRADTGPPTRAVRLSEVIQQLSTDPEFRDNLLASLDKLPNAWGLIGPKQRTRLRDYILQRNWSGMDHFPAITVGELRASVGVANSTVPRYLATTKLSEPFVEIGAFRTDMGGEVNWQPSAAELGALASAPEKAIGYGLTSGDPPHPALWQWHNRSVRASLLLNRLSLNPLLDPKYRPRVRVGQTAADSPQALINLLMHAGYNVWIEDSRYFANFGHLHFKGRDVIMPFWLDTRIPLPQSKEILIVAVSHAEAEIRIRGEGGNADVSFYFGIDGMTEFRTMDTLDQYWVGKNVAHTYRDADALEVTRLLGESLATYALLQRQNPNLPFHGYYRLGVCQDVVAAIELHMHGRTTLFPITHDPEFFNSASEVDRLFRKLPNDRRGKPEWARVRGSLPVQDLAQIQLPELRHSLETVEQAEKNLSARKPRFWSTVLLATVLSLGAVSLALIRRRRITAATVLRSPDRSG